MMSPARMPAFSAGLSGNTSATSAPFSAESPNDWARSAVTGWTETPSHPRVTLPFSRSCGMIVLAMFTGMAKPIPWPPATMAVLMPITSPFPLKSGPPEFPGLMEASV